jgi:hypothetical protein
MSTDTCLYSHLQHSLYTAVYKQQQRKDLFRCLLGLLSAQNSTGLVARALSALTRSVSGDPVESRVFEPNNALQTAQLVFAKVIDVSGRR